jgi:BirA family transcriptional regulator, biotin operon repressor / biotin---[acetyl-CoA-carboxylase] ligase
MNFTILRFDEIGSTNTEALNQAQSGAEEGLSIVARRQTAGRGRHGRTWVSEKDSGLYFSFVLRPKIETKFTPLITLMTAIAVHDALEATFEIDCDIKWVNDIHVKGKKICGILAETVETIKGFAVIVGIGINLKSSNFPAELSEIATSIEAETGEMPDAEILLRNLTRFLSYFCDVLYGENGAENIRQEWIQRSSYAYGKRVRARLENQLVEGKTCGIEPNGALRIKLEDGDIRTIHAGEIEQLRAT